MNNIHVLETILHLESHIPQINEETLVLFDVGDVLLVPENALLQGKIKAIREQLRAAYLAPLGQERHKHLWSLVLQGERRQLVEPHTPQVIENLQQKGAKVMALTALQTGPLGTIESMEDWRLGHLRTHGIQFTQVAAPLEYFVLNELVQDDYSPVYKTGALFTYKHSKGQTLTAFLNRISWKPGCIVFVDDKREMLDDVAAAAQALSIPFLGFHYQVAYGLRKPLDEQLTERQFKHLVEHGVWVTESEARKLF